jgi:hypothetical protein
MAVILSKNSGISYWQIICTVENGNVNFLTVSNGLNFEKVVDPNILGKNQSGIALRMKLIFQYCFKVFKVHFGMERVGSSR